MDGNEIVNTNTEVPVSVFDKEGCGELKIFIGYAPGVGKTYTMLNEGNRRKKYGEDVVIGYLESHGRPDTEKQVGNLEIIPNKKIKFNKVEMEEMNTEAIIARKPQLVLIDELAHFNVSGSKNKKRYMDVEEILANGINVITTLNIQHLESLNDVVHQITGTKVKETIPDYIVQKADEVVVVDLTPEALINRLKRGNIFRPSEITIQIEDFFRRGNLNALREMALRQTADEVDEELNEYMRNEGIKDNWRTAERIMVCISPNLAAKKLIRRGARLANRYKCDWYVVSVNCTNAFAKKPSLKDRQLLHSHFELSKQLGADVVTLEGKSVSEELTMWANEKHITQMFIGYPRRSKLETFLRGSTVNRLIKKLNNVDLHLIANDF